MMRCRWGEMAFQPRAHWKPMSGWSGRRTGHGGSYRHHPRKFANSFWAVSSGVADGSPRILIESENKVWPHRCIASAVAKVVKPGRASGFEVSVTSNDAGQSRRHDTGLTRTNRAMLYPYPMPDSRSWLT